MKNWRASSISELPSFGLCADDFPVTVDPFGAVDGPPTMRFDDHDEMWWYNRVSTQYEKCKYGRVIGRLATRLATSTQEQLSAWTFTYDEDSLRTAFPDYMKDPAERYGLSSSGLYGLMARDNIPPEDLPRLFAAEGLILRLLISVGSHLQRLKVLDIWTVLASKICGGGPVYVIDKLRGRLWGTNPSELACEETDCLQSFLRQAKVTVQVHGQWFGVIKKIREVRMKHWGPAAWDQTMCAMHWSGCAITAPNDVNMEGDTEPNTPSTEPNTPTNPPLSPPDTDEEGAWRDADQANADQHSDEQEALVSRACEEWPNDGPHPPCEFCHHEHTCRHCDRDC